MRSPRPRSWWLAALLTGLTTTGCQELSRTIEEVVTVVTLAVAFGIVVLALVFLGLAVRGLVKRERTKAPLVGFVVFGAVPVAIALWWAVYALVESYPHEPILLTPLLGVWAWLIQLRSRSARGSIDASPPSSAGRSRRWRACC